MVVIKQKQIPSQYNTGCADRDFLPLMMNLIVIEMDTRQIKMHMMNCGTIECKGVASTH